MSRSQREEGPPAIHVYFLQSCKGLSFNQARQGLYRWTEPQLCTAFLRPHFFLILQSSSSFTLSFFSAFSHECPLFKNMWKSSFSCVVGLRESHMDLMVATPTATCIFGGRKVMLLKPEDTATSRQHLASNQLPQNKFMSFTRDSTIWIHFLFPHALSRSSVPNAPSSSAPVTKLHLLNRVEWGWVLPTLGVPEYTQA